MMRALLLGAGLGLMLAAGGPVAAQQPGAPGAVSPSGDPVERRLVFLLERLEQLEREMRQMRGELEEMGHQMEGVKRRQRELYLDLDRRLRELELGAAAPRAAAPAPEAPGTPAAGAATAPAAPAPSGEQPAPASPTAAPALPTAAERQAYDEAFELLKQGRYDRSIEAFGRFLSTYPESTYADNAQYWLGEANYVSRKYEAAAQEFQKVMDNYPDSSKVPDAMLKLGFTQYELKNWQRARELLERVTREHPDTTAASLARTRLQRMRTEGH